MTPDNPKIQALLALGKPTNDRDWPDYIKLYDLDEDDVPALLALYRDDELHCQGEDEAALWAALHAWRALGQLRAGAAIEPLIASFDTLFEDDYAIAELCKVMAMLGSSAIDPLCRFWQQPGRDEFAYVMAMDSLYEIASAYPQSRDRVIAIYRDYMARPFEAHDCLNGLLMLRLVDLDARELIDDIRLLFARNCVDISCIGDLEDVEILLGLRDQRSTPKPDYSVIGIPGHSDDDVLESPVPDDDDIYGVIDHWLMRYGHDASILDVSEMDGYFAAIACAPELIMASSWIPAIWGGEELAPDWASENDVNQFCTALLALYNSVVEDLQSDQYSALFLENTHGEPRVFIVDEWCEGFLRGICLWGSLSAADSAMLDTCLKPIKLFTSEHSSDYLMSIDASQMDTLQAQIEPAVSTLYQHFFKTRKKASTTYVHTAPKVGRNSPCPCGSGKKYKKCCGLN